MGSGAAWHSNLGSWILKGSANDCIKFYAPWLVLESQCSRDVWGSVLPPTIFNLSCAEIFWMILWWFQSRRPLENLSLGDVNHLKTLGRRPDWGFLLVDGRRPADFFITPRNRHSRQKSYFWLHWKKFLNEPFRFDCILWRWSAADTISGLLDFYNIFYPEFKAKKELLRRFCLTVMAYLEKMLILILNVFNCRTQVL